MDVSVWTTLLVCPAVAVYAILARPRPEAIGLCALCAASAIVSLLALRLPWDRMVRSQWREAYYATWWIAEFSVIVVAILLGGGPGSPLLLLVFILLVFTGLSYPTASVVIATTITLLTVIALAIAYAEPVETLIIQLTAFASTGLMAYLQTRNHDRRAQALSESEQRLAEAQQIAHMGSWEWRAGINRVTISDELRRILGVPATEAPTTAATYLDRIHPSDRDEITRIARGALAAGQPFSAEFRVVDGDGGIRSVAVHGSGVLHNGRPVRLSGVCQDITELRRVEARLRHHADHDPLTGLLTRRRLIAEIDRQLTSAASLGSGGALLLLDVDGFAFYNDSYGQAAGDALLRSIANALVRRLRSTDVVARSGGDEFAVVLPDATSEDAVRIAQELRSLLSDCAGEPTVTASVGIATFGPDSEIASDDVLVAADIAVHDAKGSGGNRVMLYSGQSGPDLTWTHRIRDALAENRFVLHGQPIIDLESGEVSHHELLIRMRDADGSLITPDAFLPTAERFGLINAIDRWVAQAAVSLAEAGHRIALNLSANSIGDPELIEATRAAVERGLDPAMLTFEITETAAIANLQEAREFSAALAGIGCQLAIDDFGTGFGSLTYLKHIPARFVKIDREFVTDLTTSATDRHVIRAVVGIAQSLGQRTVAEGVENAETLAIVRRLGVDYVQGFYTGRPAQMWPAPEALIETDVAA